MENSSQHNLNQLPTGTELGDFRITGVIGEGGFGIVYLALETTLDRAVAVKEYLPAAIAGRTGNLSVQVRSQANNDAFASGLKNFLREARLLARFSHPAVVEVHRVWEQNGTAYMAMRYYAGKTLREWRQANREFDEGRIREILEPILDALTSLHEQNVIHRDVSPDNILMRDSGAPVLLDLGAARQVIGGMTQALTTVLKPGYAPIEQYVDDGTMDQGPWTDVYGVGAVLYYLLVGAPPPQAIARMINDPLANMASSVKLEVSPALIETVIKALAVKPENRFQSIAELRAGLQWTPSAPPVTRPTATDASTRLVEPASPPRSEPPKTVSPLTTLQPPPEPAPAQPRSSPRETLARTSGETDNEATVLWRGPPVTGSSEAVLETTDSTQAPSTIAATGTQAKTGAALGPPPAEYTRSQSSPKWIAIAAAAVVAAGGGYLMLGRSVAPAPSAASEPAPAATNTAQQPSASVPAQSGNRPGTTPSADATAAEKKQHEADNKAKAPEKPVAGVADKSDKAKADADAKEKAAKAKAENDERVAAAKAKAKQDADDRAAAKARADAEERARRLKQEEDDRVAQAKAKQAAAEKQTKAAPAPSGGARSVEELATLAAAAHRNGESLTARKLWTELVNLPSAQPRSRATAYNNMAVSYCQAGDEINCERMYAAALRADRSYNVDEAERTHPHTRAAYDRAFKAVRGGGATQSSAPSSNY
ncbi:MAG: serine/threonine protein kinase [Burkholderiales bacterium]|nr:serine/threonine protein kinase [Burkholderiales bacterium]